MAEDNQEVPIIDDIIDFEEPKDDDIEELEPLKNDDIMILKDEGDISSSQVIAAVKTSEATLYVATKEATEEIVKKDEEDDDDSFEDETLAERLWGLTEMFPSPVRDATWTISTSSVSAVKGLYQFSRSALWIIATSAIILAAPPLLENEKAQLDELNRQQQRQILLGPSASMPSGAPGMMPTLTPPAR